jgi:hypothetical protein
MPVHFVKRLRGFDMTQYEIQTSSFCDGFVNMWSDDNEDPITWETHEEAANALRLHLLDDKWLDPNSYRIAKVATTTGDIL